VILHLLCSLYVPQLMSLLTASSSAECKLRQNVIQPCHWWDIVWILPQQQIY